MHFRFHVQRLVKVFGLATALATIGASASAQSTPSSKATFAYSNLISLPACNTTDAAGCGGTSDTGWKPILRQQIKLANQKDLFFNASLQCGIVTDTTVKSLNGSLDSAEARATIRVRVKLTAPNGTVSYAQPSTGVDATNAPQGTNGGVVFCDRVQTLKAKFSGLNCRVDGTGAVTCSDPEELQLILKTLNANAFNFVAANRTPGVHTVEVQATTSASGTTPGINGVLNKTSAFIGAGSVAVEAVRMIKGNDGTTLEIQ